jgi:hypothetical protein
MSIILENMTILEGLKKTGDVELNFYKNEETGEMYSIELISRSEGQHICVEYKEIDNMIAMLQMVKSKAA